MQSEKETYAGLFWGAVVPDEIREPFLDFLAMASTAPHLSGFAYQTWRLENGTLCIGLPLAEVPPIPDGLIASSKATRSIPTRWIADTHLTGLRRDFLVLQQVAAQHGFLLPHGETLLVTPFRPEESGAIAPQVGVEPREATLLECLATLDELDVSLMAVRVPDEWGLVSPYWTAGHLLGIITGEFWGGSITIQDYEEARARFVLVQDMEEGVFAEIHCRCGEGELTRLLVVDILANTEVREWMRAKRTSRWLEVTLAVAPAGLLDW